MYLQAKINAYVWSFYSYTAIYACISAFQRAKGGGQRHSHLVATTLVLKEILVLSLSSSITLRSSNSTGTQQRERLMGSPLWIWLFRRMAWLLLPVRGNLHSPSQLLMLILEGSSKNFLKDTDKLWSRHWLGTDGPSSSALAALWDLSTSQVLSTICRAFRSKTDRYWASLWSLATINES